MTARDVSFSTLWAVINRPYSSRPDVSSAACPEAIDETAGSLFNRGHGIENRSEFVVPGKDLAHLVGSKLLDGWTKRPLELREQHSEPAARRLHDGWRFSLDHLISRVAQISRSPVD